MSELCDDVLLEQEGLESPPKSTCISLWKFSVPSVLASPLLVLLSLLASLLPSLLLLLLPGLLFVVVALLHVLLLLFCFWAVCACLLFAGVGLLPWFLLGVAFGLQAQHLRAPTTRGDAGSFRKWGWLAATVLVSTSALVLVLASSSA
jgi:hypothetical protein